MIRSPDITMSGRWGLTWFSVKVQLMAEVNIGRQELKRGQVRGRRHGVGEQRETNARMPELSLICSAIQSRTPCLGDGPATAKVNRSY